MVKEVELRLEAAFASERKDRREGFKEVVDTVRTRRRRTMRFWLGLAAAFLIAMLASLAGGVWIQWEHEPLSPKDPTGGWRDYIWDEYGGTIHDCIVEMRETGSAIDCRLLPPRP